MAGPGVLSAARPASPTPLVPHDYSQSSYVYSDTDSLWYVFTSPTSGLVTFDLYLTADSTGNQPLDLEAYVYLDGGAVVVDSWYQTTPAGDTLWLERLLLRVTAGTPVYLASWGGKYVASTNTYDTAPIQHNLRVSDVVPETYSDWVPVTATKTFGQPNDGFTRNRTVDLDFERLRSYSGARRLSFEDYAVVNGTVDRDLIGVSLDRARLTYNATAVSSPYPAVGQVVVPNTEWRSTTNSRPPLGWLTYQGGSTTQTTARHRYVAMFLQVSRIGYYGVSSGEVPLPVPASDDTIHVEIEDEVTNNWANTVTQIEVAPDEIPSTVYPYRSDIKWVIAPATARVSEDPNGWGARYGNSTTPWNVIGNAAGPESLLGLPNAQTVTYSGGVAPYTPISTALMDAARANAGSKLQDLMIHGMTAAALSSANPLPSDFTYTPGTDPIGQWDSPILLLRVTWTRRYRTVAMPALFTPDVAPTIRMTSIAGRRRFRPR